VVVDCARSDKWLGADRPTRTPNFDRFASQAIRLPTCIVEKSCTTPSFTTLLTGRYSPRHGVHLVWGYKLPESVPLLTESFAARGYNTYAEVSGPLLPEMGLARGFQEYEYRAPCDYLHTAWGERFFGRLRGRFYKSPWLILLHIWELHPHRYVARECDSAVFGRNEYERAISSLDLQLPRLFDAAGEDALIVFTGDHGEKTQFEEYRPETAVDYSRRLLKIDDARGMAPFSVAGWAGPSVLQEMYSKCTPQMRRVRLRDTAATPRFDRGSRLRDRLRMLRLTPFVYLTDLLKLGAPLKLTEMLKRRGLLDAGRARSKVARLSRAVGEQQLLEMHMRMWTNSYKHNMLEGHMVHVYDFLVRVPLVFRLPKSAGLGKNVDKIATAGVIERMVRQPDILPTILDLLGLTDETSAAAIDGRSFAPLLRGEDWEPAPAFLSVSGCPSDLEIRGVRTEAWKFTFGPENDELPQELYDLRGDPGELRNLAARRPDMCDELRGLANSFAEATVPVSEMAVAGEDQGRIETHLRQLGYIE
jgi:arylsulfatase A-like enzyme